MLTLPLLTLALAADPSVVWHADFHKASLQAKDEKKDLLIHFRNGTELDAALDHPAVRARLAKLVCVRLPIDYQYKGKRMLDRAPLADMQGRPGLCVVSRHDESLPTHDYVVSAHPLVGSRYGWVPGLGAREICVLLDLPPKASLSQRSMIYAVAVHPDGPNSVRGHAHPAFLVHAERHSTRQAFMRNQHHANIIAVIDWLSPQVGAPLGNGSEVVAESWGMVVGGETLLEACFSCVDAWRQSPSHWGAVMRPHRYFGYDISQGANGTWYATGIFAD